ncbi:hypothetical protein TNCT_335711 [Trichonephila clavata]|uniref:Uncharacterized protein n=1 Tax=Trichonephila clavata TaxID=2740835 RepID=A0A8X6L5R7_TRICU|nr:hypothetical protein TNCT_335711 [Trichonephila clavata]
MEVLQGFYDSKQFLPPHTVVSFWFGQTLTKIGDDTLLTIYSWDNTAPMLLRLASVSRINCFPVSGYARIGADVSASLSLLNALLHSSIQMNFCFASVSLWSGLAIVLRNLSRVSGNTYTSPKNTGAGDYASGFSSFSQPRSYPGPFEHLPPK